LLTMVDPVGACTVMLRPLVDLIETHVTEADRLLARGNVRRRPLGPMSAMAGHLVVPVRKPYSSIQPGISPISRSRREA
ncbi:MAG: hypothetical protein ACR2RE_19135, partial [Geminicoccaceae bacterium]